MLQGRHHQATLEDTVDVVENSDLGDESIGLRMMKIWTTPSYLHWIQSRPLGRGRVAGPQTLLPVPTCTTSAGWQLRS